MSMKVNRKEHGQESERGKSAEVVRVTSQEDYVKAHELADTQKRPFIAIWEDPSTVVFDLDTARLRLTEQGKKEVFRILHDLKGLGYFAKVGFKKGKINHLPTQLVGERLQSIFANPANVETQGAYYSRTRKAKEQRSTAVSVHRVRSRAEVGQIEDGREKVGRGPVGSMKSRKGYEKAWFSAHGERRASFVVWQHSRRVQVDLEIAGWRFTDQGLDEVSEMFDEGRERFGIRKSLGHFGIHTVTVEHLPPEWVVEQLESIVGNPANVETDEDYYRRIDDKVAIRPIELRKSRSATSGLKGKTEDGNVESRERN